MATVNLGRIKPVFKGTWSNSTAYTVDDFVVHSNECYIAIQAGSNQNPASASSYWTKIASKGADGTDVGAALSNNQIAYKNNSGTVTGLSIGTAGQFLKVNSSANGYEYGAVSSDYVKIASTDITAVSSISFQDIFNNTTYNTYKIFLQQVHMSTAQSSLQYRWLTSGSTEDSTSTYWGWMDGAYLYFADNSTGFAKDTHRDGSYGQLSWWGGWTDNDDHAGMNVMELTLLDPYRNKMSSNSWGGSMLINGSYCYEGASNNRYHMVSNGNHFQKNLTTKSGIKFYCSSGTFDAGGVISIYGMKA